MYDSVLDRQAARVQHGKIVHVKPGAWTNMDEYQTLSESDINQIGQQFEDIANACKCNKYPQIANEKAQSGAVTLLTFPNQNFWPAWHDSLQDISVSYDAQGPKHNHQRDLCSNVWALTDTAGHLFPSIYKFKAMKHLYVNIISMMYDNVSSYFACVWYESCASTIC